MFVRQHEYAIICVRAPHLVRVLQARLKRELYSKCQRRCLWGAVKRSWSTVFCYKRETESAEKLAYGHHAMDARICPAGDDLFAGELSSRKHVCTVISESRRLQGQYFNFFRCGTLFERPASWTSSTG